jgi:hypothetical protein
MKSPKQIYNQTYANMHPDLMRINACIFYAKNRDSILLKNAYKRYLGGAKLRKETIDRLLEAGLLAEYNVPKYLTPR